jgi:hypothetical protein
MRRSETLRRARGCFKALENVRLISVAFQLAYQQPSSDHIFINFFNFKIWPEAGLVRRSETLRRAPGKKQVNTTGAKRRVSLAYSFRPPAEKNIKSFNKSKYGRRPVKCVAARRCAEHG